MTFAICDQPQPVVSEPAVVVGSVLEPTQPKATAWALYLAVCPALAAGFEPE